MVIGQPTIEYNKEIYEGYVLGKQEREGFPNESYRANKPLQLVCIDLCDLMDVALVRRAKYFMIFINDFIRMTWVYFFKFKSNALQYFINLKNIVERPSRLRILTLKLENI